MNHSRLSVSQGFWAMALFFGVAALTGCGDTASRRYQAMEQEFLYLERDNKELRARLEKAEGERDSYRSMLEENKMKRPNRWRADLTAARKANSEKEQIGFDRGRLAMYRSLRMTGTPIVEGTVFRDYFYEFRVEMDGQVLAAHRIKTAEAVPPMSRELSAITGHSSPPK